MAEFKVESGFYIFNAFYKDVPRDINAMDTKPIIMPMYVQTSYLWLKTKASRIKVNTRVKTVIATKACATPKTDRGLPIRNLPRKRITKAMKTEGVKR